MIVASNLISKDRHQFLRLTPLVFRSISPLDILHVLIHRSIAPASSGFLGPYTKNTAQAHIHSGRDGATISSSLSQVTYTHIYIYMQSTFFSPPTSISSGCPFSSPASIPFTGYNYILCRLHCTRMFYPSILFISAIVLSFPAL